MTTSGYFKREEGVKKLTWCLNRERLLMAKPERNRVEKRNNRRIGNRDTHREKRGSRRGRDKTNSDASYELRRCHSRFL